MAERKRGRPRTEKSNRVRVSLKLDPDLKEWTEGKKRSDMVNRLLRRELQFSKGGTVNLKPGELALVGDNGGPELVDDRITMIDANNILKLLNRPNKPPKDKPREEQP